MVVVGNVLMIIGMFGCIISKNIYETYVWLFIIGMSFGGRVLVGTTYYIEYAPDRISENGPFFLLLSFPILQTLIIIWNQFIDNSWFLIQVIMLVFQILSTLYIIIWIPESPKWMYTWKRFGEAKQILAKVGEYNGVDKEKIESEILNCKFIDENA